jgi:DNA polymerase V
MTSPRFSVEPGTIFVREAHPRAAPRLEIHPIAVGKPLHLPLASSPLPAGFPSPADDYLEPSLDLNERLVKNPNATFLVRVAGDSMIGAGIHTGDLLVVDKSLEAAEGSVVVAVVNGEFTLKRFSRRRGFPELLAENPDFPPIRLGEGDEASVWGVARHVIKDL